MIMNSIETIKKSPFYEIIFVLDECSLLDYMKRSETSNVVQSDQKQLQLFPHEERLRYVKTLLLGITSAISYMSMSVLYSQQQSKHYFEVDGYDDYAIYKYHYSVFCHGLSTLHDLYFKLVAELSNFNNRRNHTIQWEELKKMLAANGEREIIQLLEAFYEENKVHEQKRNMVSHEGLLTSPFLDNYYTTKIWTNAHGRNDKDNIYPEYTDGTKENKNLLAKTNELFVDELTHIINKDIDYSVSLLDLLLPKLIYTIDSNFLDTHYQFLTDLNMECVNRYLLTKS